MEKIKLLLTEVMGGIAGAMGGVLLGFAISGWHSLKSYVHEEPVQCIIMAAIGAAVGAFIGYVGASLEAMKNEKKKKNETRSSD